MASTLTTMARTTRSGTVSWSSAGAVTVPAGEALRLTADLSATHLADATKHITFQLWRSLDGVVWESMLAGYWPGATSTQPSITVPAQSVGTGYRLRATAVLNASTSTGLIVATVVP
jgi:hypothetical protein